MQIRKWCYLQEIILPLHQPNSFIHVSSVYISYCILDSCTGGPSLSAGVPFLEHAWVLNSA